MRINTAVDIVSSVEYEPATVKRNEELASGHYLLELEVKTPLPDVRAGQFLQLRCAPADQHSLLRPFSILDVDPFGGSLLVYYKHLGRLSEQLSEVPLGTKLDCLYPLGNGFPWKADWRRIALVGGGVGLAPLLFWARQLEPYSKRMIVEAYFGGQSAEDLVPRLLEDYAMPMQLATIDGSKGYRGTVVQLFAEAKQEYDAVYTCGPNAMMAALRDVLDPACQAYASLEEYMACGVGACLGCATQIKVGEEVRSLTVCKDGPVFDLRDVIFAS